MKKVFIVSLVLLFSCTTSKNLKDVSPISLKEWTLEDMPNSLDVVGVVFGVNEQGKKSPIPGGRLEIKTKTGTTVLPETKKAKQISYGALLTFMKVTPILDSLTSLNISDTSKVDVSFAAKNAIKTFVDDDITEAFEKQKAVIKRNLTVIKDFDTTRLYLILETISSPSVKMNFAKVRKTNANAFLKLQNFFRLNPNFHRDQDDATSLTYDLQESLTIFYKLVEINRKVFISKSSGEKTIELSLGRVVQADELPH